MQTAATSALREHAGTRTGLAPLPGRMAGLSRPNLPTWHASHVRFIAVRFLGRGQVPRLVLARRGVVVSGIVVSGIVVSGVDVSGVVSGMVVSGIVRACMRRGPRFARDPSPRQRVLAFGNR